MNFSKAMKAAVIIFTGAIAAAGLTACGGIKTAADSPSKGGVKIGFIAALTGGAAAYGKSQEEGIRMAVEEINQKGAIPIELFVEDSKGSPSDAMNVTKRLIQKKAAVIIGRRQDRLCKMLKFPRWKYRLLRKELRKLAIIFSEIPYPSR